MKLVRITLILLLSLVLSLSAVARGSGGAHTPQPNTCHQLGVLCQGLALMEFQAIPYVRTVPIETDGVR
jgi:hypothetical protein